MSSPIVDPDIPFNGIISGGIQPGKMCRIQGVTHPNTDRFNINLQTGPNTTPRNDTALHISVRLNQGYIARNSFKNGAWDDEQGNGMLPICPAEAFEILILTEPNNYKVAVNGQHFCEFPHRIPFADVSHLLIDGDVSITLISWEIAKPMIETMTSEFNTEGSQLSPQQFGHQQEKYDLSSLGYSSQGPYGPAPIGYGPPLPPGVESESGFDSFLEQAQSVLAGAIKSGAAEKLLSGLLATGGHQNQSQGQGYAHQNAQYGQYPLQTPPQDKGPLENILSGLLSSGSNQQEHPQPNQYGQYPPQTPPQDKGPLENILSGLLSSGSNQQKHPQPNPQPHIPQVGGEGSIGGLGSMGGILSNLAGKILHNPRDGNQHQN